MRSIQPSQLHLQVRDDLARRIAHGHLPPGGLLPSELILSDKMQVSVGTIRKAVEMLVSEKLLRREQGRGLVISDYLSLQFRSQFDHIRNADGSAISWKLGKSDIEVRAASAGEIRVLHLNEGDEADAIIRIGGQTP